MASKVNWYRSLAAIAVTAIAMLALGAPSARAADEVSSYTVKATVNADGSLAVKATLTFNGAAPASVRQEFTTATRTVDRMEYHATLAEVSATSAGKQVDAKVDQGPNRTVVELPTAGLTEPVELSYLVRGAAIATADGTTTVVWAPLQGLSVPVKVFDATVGVPGQFTMIDCAAGAPDSPGACTYYSGGTHDAPNPVFHQEVVDAGDLVLVTLRFPTDVVAVNQDLRETWSLDRAFSAQPLPLGVALGLLLLGGLGLWALHRRVGRDADAGIAPALVAEFHPIGPGQSEFRVLDGIRPGEVGTLMDESVDPVDVTATLLDLAVRGHLLITELPPETEHGLTDWTFARRAGKDKLLAYEHTLLDAVAPIQGEPVRVSNLAGTVHAVIGQVQSELYDEVAERGWFAHRPDSTRGRWSLIGWVSIGVAVVAAVLLAAFTRFGLAGLALIALGLGVLFVAQEMPARTASGTAIRGGLDVLRGSLLTQPVDAVAVGEGYGQLSAILPYAIVLGGRDRWLQAVVDADGDADADATDLDWYHGPSDWHLKHLPASVANFVTTVTGTLFTR